MICKLVAWSGGQEVGVVCSRFPAAVPLARGHIFGGFVCRKPLHYCIDSFIAQVPFILLIPIGGAVWCSMQNLSG